MKGLLTLGPVVTAAKPGTPRTAASMALPLAFRRISRPVMAAMGTGERRISVLRLTPVTTTSPSVLSVDFTRTISSWAIGRMTVWVVAAYPTALNCSCCAPAGKPGNVKRPFASAAAPCCKAGAATLAKGTGWPFWSRICPRKAPVWASIGNTGKQARRSVRNVFILAALNLFFRFT